MAEKYLGESNYKKKGKHHRPNLAAPKDNEFYIKMSQYIWSQYVRNSTTISYGGYSGSTGKSFTELRLYALGQQSKVRYAKLLDDCDELTQEGELNINWDIVQILPKFRDIVKGKLAGIDFEVNTQALDEMSNKERLKRANKMKLLTSPIVKQYIEQYGRVPSNIKLPEYINTAEDVDMYIKMGGVRLEYEMAMRDAIESTKYESRWSTLKDKIVEDIIDLGICAVKTKVHPKTHKVIADYVDPMYLVIQPSKYADHRDSSWAGEIRTVTIAQLRMESSLTEGQLMEIAKKYKGKGGNASNFEVPVGIEWEKSYRTDYDWDTSQISYNDFSVDILEWYSVAKDVEKYIVGVREDAGNMIYDKVGRKAKLSKKDEKKGKEIESNIIEKVYKCCWVIGTNTVFDNQEEYAIAKAEVNGVKEALLPIQVYSNKTKSIVERCIRFVDDIQLATLKKANTLAKMAPGPRMLIDKSILRDSVNIGKDNYSMLDLVNLYSKSGVMIVESVAEYENDEGPSNRRPVDFMPAAVQEDLQIFLNEIAHNIDQIRQVTGVNEVADGSTQRGDMLVRVMEGLNAATNNALRPHFRLYEGLYTNWCKYTVLKWQTALMGGEINVDFVPIGDSTIQTVALSEDLYLYDFGVHVTLIPSEKDRQLLLQDLMNMKNQNQLGVDDYYVLYNMINNGDVKKSQLYLSRAARQHRDMLQQQEMQKMKAQGEANGQAAQMAAQAAQQTEQVKLQAKLAVIAAQGEEDRKTIQFQAKFDLERDGQKAANDMGKDVMNKGLDTGLAIQQQQAQAQENQPTEQPNMQ
jgi:hypothetical protein